MATIYSDYTERGPNMKNRVRVDYEGTKASATLLHSCDSNTLSGGARTTTFTFAGQTTTATKQLSGKVEDMEIATVWFDIPLEGGTYSGEAPIDYSSASTPFGWRGSVVIPPQTTTETPEEPEIPTVEEKLVLPTMEQWKDLANRVKNVDQETFSDADWSSMWD